MEYFNEMYEPQPHALAMMNFKNNVEGKKQSEE